MRSPRMAGPVLLGSAVLLAMFSGCTTGVVQPTTPVRFAYGGKAGETRVWKLEQVLRGEFTFGAMPQLLVITLRGGLSERIDEVTPEGWRRVTQHWTFEPVEFNGMAVPLDAIPRELEAHVVRGPAGQLQPMEEHADAAGDLLAWAARWIGGLFPLLPDHPVPAGEAWSADETMPVGRAAPRPAEGGGSEFHLVSKGVFKDMEGRIARFATEGEITLTRSAAGGGSGMETFHLQNAGEVLFDVVAGSVTSSRQTGSLSFKGRTGKSPLTIRARFTSTFTPRP